MITHLVNAFGVLLDLFDNLYVLPQVMHGLSGPQQTLGDRVDIFGRQRRHRAAAAAKVDHTGFGGLLRLLRFAHVTDSFEQLRVGRQHVEFAPSMLQFSDSVFHLGERHDAAMAGRWFGRPD